MRKPSNFSTVFFKKSIKLFMSRFLKVCKIELDLTTANINNYWFFKKIVNISLYLNQNQLFFLIKFNFQLNFKQFVRKGSADFNFEKYSFQKQQTLYKHVKSLKHHSWSPKTASNYLSTLGGKLDRKEFSMQTIFILILKNNVAYFSFGKLPKLILWSQFYEDEVG